MVLCVLCFVVRNLFLFDMKILELPQYYVQDVRKLSESRGSGLSDGGFPLLVIRREGQTLTTLARFKISHRKEAEEIQTRLSKVAYAAYKQVNECSSDRWVERSIEVGAEEPGLRFTHQQLIKSVGEKLWKI